DFLCSARLGQQVTHILALSLFRRLLIEKLVKTQSHAALEGERKRRRRQREDDQKVVQAREQRRHQSYRHNVARQSQDGPCEVSGPPGDFALGARQTVVPVGGGECSDVVLRSLSQQPPLRFQLNTPDEQISAVAHVRAHCPLRPGGNP